MGTSLIDNFDYRSRRFLDKRQSVGTLAALKAVPENTVPDGFRAYCEADGQWYEYNSANEPDVRTGKWRSIKDGEDDTIKDILNITQLHESEVLTGYYIKDSSIIKSSKSYSCVAIFDIDPVMNSLFVKFEAPSIQTMPYMFTDEEENSISQDIRLPELSDENLSVKCGIVCTKGASKFVIAFDNRYPIKVFAIGENVYYASEEQLTDIRSRYRDIKTSIFGYSDECELKFTALGHVINLPFTIPAGATIKIDGNIETLSGRTSMSDSTYQRISNGTIADRDIKIVKHFLSTGNLPETIKLSYEVKGEIAKLEDRNSDTAERYAKACGGAAARKSSEYNVRPLKLLGIGNSWTLNATAFLGEILNGLGIKIEIAVSYAGSATLKQYDAWIEGKSHNLQLRHWDGSEWTTALDMCSYDEILAYDDWDIITHQQQSGNGGNYDSFQPYLHRILEYDRMAMDLTPLCFLHATWAYPTGYENETFQELYGSDTEVMYSKILEAYNTALIDEGIKHVMPSTPVIQQIRKLGIPNVDTSDGGSHASTAGCFAASCVWAETLLRKYYNPTVSRFKSITDSEFVPTGMSDTDAATIREVAKQVVQDISTYFPAVN